MDKPWWLEEPYVSRILDEITIEKNGDEVRFSLSKARNKEAECIALVNDARRVLGDDLLHCICDWFLHECLRDEQIDWDGDWLSLPDGTWMVDVDYTICDFDQSVFDGYYLREMTPEDTGAVPPNPRLVGFPRFWELLGFILPRPVRERVFTPAYYDLVADHLRASRAEFQTPWAKRWIALCFGFRTIILIACCVPISIRAAICAALICIIPTGLRSVLQQLWRHLFNM